MEPDMTDIGEDCYFFEHSEGHNDDDMVHDDYDEVLVIDEQGTLRSLFHLFLNDGQLDTDQLEVELNTQQVDMLNRIAKSIGRVYSYYTLTPDEPVTATSAFKVFSGTAFRLSNSHLVTAHHVVKEQKYIKNEKLLETQRVNEEGRTYYRRKVFVTFAPYGQRSSPYVGKDTTFYEVSVERSDIDNIFNHEYLVQEDDARKTHWKHLNDFCFLKFKDKKPKLKSLLLPSVDSNNTDLECKYCVIGYPGYIKESDFSKKYGDSEIKYGHLHRMAGGFNRKVLSIGQCNGMTTDQSLIKHQCSTLGGTSGAVFFELKEGTDPSIFSFVGVHIGGDRKMSNNYVIGVHKPEFVVEYCRQVCDDDFMKQNFDYLKRYLSPYLHLLEEHVPKVHELFKN